MSPGELFGQRILSIPQPGPGRDPVSNAAAAPAPRSTALRPRDLTVTRAVIGVVLALTLLFAVSDLLRPAAHPHVAVCVPARLLRTALIAGLAWYTGRRGVDRVDTTLVALAMLTALIGDIFLVAQGALLAGMASFAGVQVLLALRHRRVILVRKRQSVPWWPIGLAFVMSAAVWGMIFPILATSPLLVPFTAFLALLTLSLGLAWGQVIRGGWQDANDLEAALGMTCFYLCDVSYGVCSALFNAQLPGAVLARAAVDVFYTPALLLLVLSAHSWPVGFSRWLGSEDADHAQARA